MLDYIKLRLASLANKNTNDITVGFCGVKFAIIAGFFANQHYLYFAKVQIRLADSTIVLHAIQGSACFTLYLCLSNKKTPLWLGSQ